MKTINFKFEDENSILVSKLTAKKKKKKKSVEQILIF